MAGLKTSLRRGSSLSTSLTSLGARAPSQGGGVPRLRPFGLNTHAPVNSQSIATAVMRFGRRYLGQAKGNSWGFEWAFPSWFCSAGNDRGKILPMGAYSAGVLTQKTVIQFTKMALVASPTLSYTDVNRVTFPVTFGGSAGVTIDPDVTPYGVVNDPVVSFANKIPVGWYAFLEYSYVVTGTAIPICVNYAPNQSLQAGTSHTTTSQDSKVGTGTVVTQGALTANDYGPMTCACFSDQVGKKSWVVFGDSIGRDQNETAYGFTVAGVSGWLPRALELAGYECMNLCIPSSTPSDWVGGGSATADLANYWDKIEGLLDLHSERPFGSVIFQGGTNAAGVWNSGALYKQGLKDTGAFIKTRFGSDLKINQATTITKVNTSSDGYQTTASQNLITGFANGSYVYTTNLDIIATRLDGVFDGFIDPWSAYGIDGDPTKVAPNSDTGQATTLGADYAGGTSVTLTNVSLITLGDAIRLDPAGVGAPDNAQIVRAIAGNVVTLINAFQHNALANATVVGSFMSDNTHPTRQGHIRIASRVSLENLAA